MGLPDDVRRLFGSASGHPTQVQLDASNIETLVADLESLGPEQRGWITFEDYRRIFEQTAPAEPVGARRTRQWNVAHSWSGEWAWEFEAPRAFEWSWNSAGALKLAALAKKAGCMPVRSPAERRFYFSRDTER